MSTAWLVFAAEAKAAFPQSNHTTGKIKPTQKTQAEKTSSRASGAKVVKRSNYSGTRSSARSVKGKKRPSRGGSRQRLAALHLDPQRVEEIQQALIREGVLAGSATGAWDDATRDAMRRYQDKNGFTATGLPDAKSLMQLGLGPHPLPDDVKPLPQTQSSVAIPTKIDP